MPKIMKNLEIWLFLIIFYGFRWFWGLQEAPKYHMDSYGHSRGRIDFHKHPKTSIFCFGEFQCIRNDSQNMPFCPGPPQNTFIICLRYFETIFSKFTFSNLKHRKSGNLQIWKVETLKSLNLWNFEIFKSFETLKSLNL